MSSSKRPWTRALVTGPTAGIGAAIAEDLLLAEVDVVAVARDEARLQALADRFPGRVEVFVADLADAAARAGVAERIRATEAPVDLVVNNAGFGFVGTFATADLDGERAMVDVNVIALMELTHAAAGVFVERGGGAILNVSSVAAHLVSPLGATYAATKAFVTSLGESVATELAPEGVTLTTVEPGLTRTEFHARASVDYSDVPARLWSTAEQVATAALNGAASGAVTVVPGAHNKLGRGVLGNLPGPIRRRLSLAANRRSGEERRDGR